MAVATASASVLLTFQFSIAFWGKIFARWRFALSLHLMQFFFIENVAWEMAIKNEKWIFQVKQLHTYTLNFFPLLTLVVNIFQQRWIWMLFGTKSFFTILPLLYCIHHANFLLKVKSGFMLRELNFLKMAKKSPMTFFPL